MKRTRLYYLLIPVFFVGLLSALFLMDSEHPAFDEKYARYDNAFDSYLSAFTSGEISRKSNIQIRFAFDIGEVSDEEIYFSESPFIFKPDIKGKTHWKDSRTLEFIPDEILPSGQIYQARLNMKSVIDEIPDEHNTFYFQFGSRQQGLDVNILESRSFVSKNASFQRVKGIVRTLDFEHAEKVEELFELEKDGKNLKVSWSHDEKTQTHTFVIDSIERKDKDFAVSLAWDGSKIGLEDEGEKEIVIPAKGTFRHMHTYSYGEPSDYVVLEYSDPLDKNQDLTGLIRMKDRKLTFTIDGNQIKIFPKSRIAGKTEIEVSAGIRSESGDKTVLPFKETVVFSTIKPEVKLIGEGVILPKSNTLPFNFEAIGLKAVDVRIIKIVEDNIPQFLQVNQLQGSNELKRVGQVVLEKRIDLDKDTELDLNSWNRHSLDLASLVHTDPGAIYEVALGYRKSYTYYTCTEEENESAEKNMLQLDRSWITGDASAEDSYWDYYYYNYRDRDDPCKMSYYNYNRIAKRNVLASDLGLIAKEGSQGSLFITTDLKTTKPLEGVKLELYDYQHQLISTATTDEKGMVEALLEKPAFLMVAKKGEQRGYLRLDDGSALSMSRFDTQGKKYYKGVKGFIYGERGVWRPGDPMYLNFILEDRAQSIPPEHPVNFTLIDSRGQKIQKIVRTQGTNGFYTFHTATEADAPTGNYLAKVEVGGAKFQKTLKVETIIPNRLKIDIDFGVPYLTNDNQNLSGTLSSRWLHGAIAKNLKADVRATLRPASTTFPEYREFNFDDPVRKFSSEEITLFDGKLNEQGTAKVPVKIHTEAAAPGKLSAQFKVQVFEPGGAFSVDRFSIPFSPYKTYVGVKAPAGDKARNMLLTDTDHNIQIATLDADGKPVSSQVEVKLYKLRWKWWFDKTSENLLDYRGRINAEELQTATVNTVNGVGSWKLNIKYPDWGRFMVRVTDKDGHASGRIIYIDWPGWAGRAAKDERGGAQMLNFEADKESYNVGEEVTLSIPTGQAGRALVSIENGLKVIKAYWVDATEGTTRFTFPTTKEMAPNVYANVTLLQPHAQTKNDLPIRLYGVIPIKIEDPQTRLSPVLAMADELEPNSEVAIKISESSGKPMTYTLAMVDEGLLDLTRFQTPSAWDAFYQRIGLDVKTWDLFDYVLGAYGGEIKSMLGIGGGAGEEGPGGKKQDRFRPVVKFLGPFELKAGQTETHKVSMPNYIGSVKTMVVAGDVKTGAYGSTEKATPVKKPLMVLGTLPRVLGPGEVVGLPVTVFAMEDNIKVVNLTVETGRRILVNGSADQIMRFSSSGEQMTVFELGVLGSLGEDHIKITARSGNQVAVYETDIEIRTPNPPVTDVFAQTVEKGDNWKQTYKPVGMRGTNEGVIEVSSIPPLNLGKRLEYLIRYPYGCIEQTTSSVFPQVYLTRLLEMDPKRKDEIDKNIRAGIKRLYHFQISSGGLAYWPGAYHASDWGTNYAGNFLLEAQKAGYTIPQDFMNNWYRYQKDKAKSWETGDKWEQMTQAYRLFLLARGGQAELGSMNRLRQVKGLEDMAKWYLAGAYHQAGQDKVAERLIRGLSKELKDYKQLGNTYGSAYRDRAIIVQVLSVMGEKEEASPLIKILSDRLSNNEWMSTHETAYSLIAMAEYIGKGAKKDKMKFAYRINGGEWTDVNYNSLIWQMNLEEVVAGDFEFKNKGSGALYPRLVLQGTPREGDKTDAANGLNLKVSYQDLNGKGINPEKLEQGTDFLAQVTVTNTSGRHYEEMALNQIFPSGWEIHNSRMDGTAPGGDTPEYQDIRDDRVYTFFDLKAGKTQTFKILLNASYLGKYYLPTVSVEAMYDKTINARKHGQWVNVVEPGQGG